MWEGNLLAPANKYFPRAVMLSQISVIYMSIPRKSPLQCTQVTEKTFQEMYINVGMENRPQQEHTLPFLRVFAF